MMIETKTTSATYDQIAADYAARWAAPELLAAARARFAARLESGARAGCRLRAGLGYRAVARSGAARLRPRSLAWNACRGAPRRRATAACRYARTAGA